LLERNITREEEGYAIVQANSARILSIRITIQLNLSLAKFT
jgi:hypothetical protein